MVSVIHNVFCFEFGKHEPEHLLSGIHIHQPIILDELRKFYTRGKISRWLPFLIDRGYVVSRDGVLHCRCKECRHP